MRFKLMLCVAGTLLFISCSATVRNYLEPLPEKPAADSSTAVPATSESGQSGKAEILQYTESRPEMPPPATLLPSDWIGKQFAVLDKQELFRKFGYELYTCPQLDLCKGAIDASRETSNHRALYQKLNGRIVKIMSVEQRKNEWFFSAQEESTGEIFYGQTQNVAHKELGLQSDLDYARERWLGKFVFSRRRVISTVQTGSSNFGSEKVSIQDSLKVVEVRWGTTPLPVKPVWLMVETRKGIRGFIPVWSSYTNVPTTERRPAKPWRDDILEQDPTATYKWDEAIWEVINNHRVVVEMNRDQVLMSWGSPESTDSITRNGVKMERWRFAIQYLIFDESGLIAIEDVPRGK